MIRHIIKIDGKDVKTPSYTYQGGIANLDTNAILIYEDKKEDQKIIWNDYILYQPTVIYGAGFKMPIEAEIIYRFDAITKGFPIMDLLQKAQETLPNIQFDEVGYNLIYNEEAIPVYVEFLIENYHKEDN